MRLRSELVAIAVAGSLLWGISSAHAQETVTYTYDAAGRVTQVQHSGGPISGTTTQYTYDAADNRTLVTVNGSPNGNGTGADTDGNASVPQLTYVILPLNGFAVISFVK
jgi:YD repeat-containing protein